MPVPAPAPVDVPLAPAPDGVDADAWAAASAAVRAYCGWHIAPSIMQTVTVDGPGGKLLMLPTLRLTDLTDVMNSGQAVSDPEWSEAGMVRGSWTTKWRGITLTMTHGYDECPAEVLEVVKDMAAASGKANAGTEQAGPYSMTVPSASAASQAGAVGVSPLQRTVLDRYKLPPRP